VAQLLSLQKPRTGRPAKDYRTVLNGILSPTIRRYLKERRIGAVIPTKAGEAADPAFDRNAYRERNVVECLINRLKQWRRIATRYEKRAANYQAMLTTAAILLWR
jgi:transposase